MHGGLCNFIPTGINGVLALKDEAYKRGWLVVAHEHFEPIADPFKLKISKQLKWIRQTGTRIVVLNCYKKYSRQVRMIYNTRGSQSTNLELAVLFVCFCFCCCCFFFFFNDDGTMMNFESVQWLTHSLTKKSVTNGKLSLAAVHTYLNSKKIYILRIITVTGVTMGLLSYTPGHHVGIANSYFGME